MSQYVDGFVIPIKKKNLKKYKKMATLGRKIWMEYGALDYYECVGDDIKNTFGTPFTKIYKLKADENLIFAYVVYKSKAHRKKVVAKVMTDSRMNPADHEAVFDMKRFSMGGFKVIVRT
ncbi:MAG: DUF1428 domain-containing protein [Bryobacterales bacterium]|nr:DUF1428 domain-containing protein [Bryobacterales bacterium]